LLLRPASGEPDSTNRRGRSTVEHGTAATFVGSDPEQQQWDVSMKTIATALAAVSLLTVAACSGGADDQAAANVEAATENQAEALEAQADNMGGAAGEQLEDKAEAIEEKGEDAAEKIDDTDNAAAANGVVNGM